jgi:N-acetyl-anhydromuramyl-L-alanine amidase AmpD
MGIKNRHDLHELKEQRHKLIKVLKDLYQRHPDIVDQRIIKSKEYIKQTNNEIKSSKRRLDHFINIATNASLAQLI